MLNSSWTARAAAAPGAAAAFAPVAILGGGFCGTMIAAHLARMQVNCFLVEEHAHKAGAGAAYSTAEASHLLNVRAEGMSAWPDEPDDFAAEWRDYGRSEDAFAPRFVYRRYLQTILERAVSSGRTYIFRSGAIAARKRGDVWSIQLADGTALQSQHLVLATGNEAPRRPSWSDRVARNFMGDPWSLEAQAAIAEAAALDRDVLIIGSGLTMLDVALSLQAKGHRGRIVALSRNGLVPHGHAVAPPQFTPEGIESGALRDILRHLRTRAAQYDWRSAVDALRPNVQSLWRQLSVEEKRRFFRHARPWWDVHRHRVAPAVAARIDGMRESGQLEVIAGRIEGAEADSGGALVRIRLRGSDGSHERRFHTIVNCAGPLDRLLETRNPILDRLLRDREIEPDELGIGIAVDSTSRAKGHLNLWAAGALTKGTFWEITAVPELRVQVAQIAASIASELGARGSARQLSALATGLPEAATPPAILSPLT
jgi:uncharacterized NAD(P)/FAD-binding protein YdhS